MGFPVNLNRLKLFVALVDCGSFTKAAAALDQPKSRVSRNISALERELGIQLIYRTTRQLQVTELGREFYNDMKKALGEIHGSLARVCVRSGVIAGTIRITAPNDIGVALMAPICDELQMAHPEVHFDLFVSNEVIDLVRDGFDIAVRIGRKTYGSLIQKKIGLIRMRLVASPAFLDQFGVINTVSRLGEVPTLAFTDFETKTKWTLFHLNEKKVISLAPVFSSNNLFVLRDMAVRGRGVALLPGFLCDEEIKSGSLIQVLPSWASVMPNVSVLVPNQQNTQLRVRRFVEFVARRLKPNFS